MKKIRIGNDIVIKWRVTINGEEVNLEGLDLALYISTTYQPRKAIAFTVAGNEITATYKGAEQKVTGVYRLTLYRNEGENAQSILDACDAFELVSCSCLTTDVAFGGAEVELPVADLGVGVPGLSAYEIAVAEGFKGTQAEWLASLSAASEAAAAECREFTEAAKIDERYRQNNEALRVTAENERAAAETARQSAENKRTTAESGRANAESQRVTAETARSNAESSRTTAETARQSAETARQEAEQGRVTAEQGRVDAEAARAEEFATFEGKIAAKEDAANKVTSIGANADDQHYPSAKAVWDWIEKGYQFRGIATPTTNPGTQDGPVFYFAVKHGAYTNFNNILISKNELAIIYNESDNSWAKQSIGINDFIFPMLLEQGNIDYGTLNILPTSNRVYCKNSISAETIAKITLTNDIYIFGYRYDKFGNFVGETGYSTEIVLDDAYVYLFTFSKGSAHDQQISVGDVLSNIKVDYPEKISSAIESLKETYINALEDTTELLKRDLYGINLPTSEWYQNAYYSIGASTNPIQLKPTEVSGFMCIEVKCSQGEIFKIKVSGGGNGRGWAFLDKDRKVISRSDSYIIFEGEITAPEGTSSLILNTQSEGYVKKIAVWDKSEDNTMQRIKILCFGNSFTEDSMGYVPMILKNMIPQLEVTMGMAVIGGCKLVQHLASFTGENQALNNETYTPQNYAYRKSINGGAWEAQGSRTVDYILADEKWDIVTFQQNGSDAFGDWGVYYAPYIFKLHKSLFDKVDHNIKIGWLLTHGAYGNSDDTFLQHWQGTADNSKKMLNETGTSILFPYGTAVQNLRTTSLKALGDGSGHNLTADNGHLQDGIGCMTAAYANALTILKTVGLGKVGAIGETTRVDADYITKNNIQGSNMGTSGVVGITEDNCYLAQVAAECAIKNPYEVTDLSSIESY